MQNHKYLGMELSENLKLNTHVTSIIGKANRSFGFIRRNLHHSPEDVKKIVYFSSVRRHIDYASSVCEQWYNHTTANQWNQMCTTTIRSFCQMFLWSHARVCNSFLGWETLSLPGVEMKLDSPYRDFKQKTTRHNNPMRFAHLISPTLKGIALGTRLI